MSALHIRPAIPDDAPFVARCVCMALHREASDSDLPLFADICRSEDELYSYRHALIAEVDGIPAGLCLCYDGNGYHETRLRTFARFAALHPDEEDDMDLAHADDETGPGEYYIDSLAVLPEFRRQGIARRLMQAQIERGRTLGFSRFTLLVDPDNPDAQRLYRQLGFRHHSDCYAFGQIYWKWEM